MTCEVIKRHQFYSIDGLPMMPSARIDGTTLTLSSFMGIQPTHVIGWIEVVTFTVMSPLVEEAIVIVTRMNGHGFKDERFFDFLIFLFRIKLELKAITRPMRVSHYSHGDLKLPRTLRNASQ
jgi:hypothetical protein